jgi:hypothetical protein
MTRRTALVMASLALAFLVGPAVANAGDLLTSDIPFKFMAAGKSHDAGTYRLLVSDDLESIVLKPSGWPGPIRRSRKLGWCSTRWAVSPPSARDLGWPCGAPARLARTTNSA